MLSLHLDQAPENFAVLGHVLVAHRQRRRLLLLGAQGLQVLQGGLRVLGPELLEPPGLGVGNAAARGVGRRLGHEPLQQRALLYQRLPLVQVPLHVAQGVVLEAGVPAEEHHDPPGRGHEPEEEDVPEAAVVAFQHGVPQRVLGVQRHLAVPRPHEVVHDVTGRGAARPPVAEPLAAAAASDEALGVVDPAVLARVLGDDHRALVLPCPRPRPRLPRLRLQVRL